MTYRMRGFRMAKVSLLLGSLVLAVAIACGSDDDPTPVATAATAPTASTAPTAVSAADASAPATATASAVVVADTKAPDAMGGPSGDVVMAIRRVNSIYGVAYTGPYRGSAHQQTGGIDEYMFVMGDDGNAMSPQLADTWQVDPAGTKVTITTKSGIDWHAPLGQEQLDARFGEMVAEDIVAWLNSGNSTTNPESTYPDAGDLAAVFLEAKSIDDRTLEVGLVSPLFYGLPLSAFGILGAARGPYFRRGVDIMGLDWAQSNAVGTGPFRQGLCIPGDRCTANALDSHWRQVSSIASITMIQVPESATRIAMLKNGQIDMTEMDFKLVPGLIAEGFQFLDTQPGNFVGQSILYPGNLWEENHARTGEALNPWDAPSYASDIPWIGDPWQESHPDKVLYTDTDNPPRMTDMEQARLVRLALGTAIDRGQIKNVLLGGLGITLYSEYMGPEYPGWDPSRKSGAWTFDGDRIDDTGTQQSIDYVLADGDIDAAGALLDAAGYPLVGGTRPGIGDQLTLQKYPAEAGEVGMEVGDTVNSTWSQLGINVSQLVEDYGGVISPRMRRREQFLPVLKNGDVNSSVFPLDWPYPPVDSSISRPGWGVGFESPYLSSQHFAIRGSQDRAYREFEHMETADYMIYWQLYNGVFQIPRGVVSTDRITGIKVEQTHYGGATGYGNPETITIKD
jgi:ABC-type transport system substrate-binding protein